MSRAKPMRKTARGMRKWLSVRMARVLEEVLMGRLFLVVRRGCESAKTIIGERGGGW
jgi:hypothetical protein